MKTKRDNNGRFVKGNVSPTKGKHHTLESKLKNGLSQKINHETNPEIRNKMSLTRINLIREGKIKIWNKEKKGLQISSRKGKTYEDIYGIEKAKELRKLISNSKLENKNWLNKHHSEETKKKLSLAHKGKSLSEEHKQKIRESETGEKHYNWQDGKSFEPYGVEFNKQLKEQIRQRDNYRCQQCFRHQDELFKKCKNNKITKYKLHIHHIDYNKKNNNPNNLISLCTNCHIQTNFNRNNWTNYFNNKINGELG